MSDGFPLCRIIIICYQVRFRVVTWFYYIIFLQTDFVFDSMLMQMLVNGFCQCLADAFDLFQIFFAGGNDATQAAEAGE